MQLETVINKLIRFLNNRLDSLSINITSGGVDSMEKYKYIIGQINAFEATWVLNVIRIRRDILKVHGARSTIGLCLHVMQAAELRSKVGRFVC
jgi:hypothetical protein